MLLMQGEENDLYFTEVLPFSPGKLREHKNTNCDIRTKPTGVSYLKKYMKLEYPYRGYDPSGLIQPQ